MNTPNCNRYLLRTLLLEGENSEKVVNSVKIYVESEKTTEDYHKLSDSLKKEITATAKQLMSEPNSDCFIQEVSKQLGA
jgi:hypothetical protein